MLDIPRLLRQETPLLVLLGACTTTVDLPSASDRTAVVEALLLADSTRVPLRALWSTLPGPQFESNQDPVDAGLVRLTLIGPDGVRADFAPDPGAAGQFVASLPIRRGARYRLEGTIDNTDITAETTVPSEFVLELPSADTLRPVQGGQVRFPYRFRGNGATSYVASHARFSETVSVGWATTSREGEFDVDFNTEPYTSWFFALNLDAGRYALDQGPARTNVIGAYGYLGAAIAVGKVVVWH